MDYLWCSFSGQSLAACGGGGYLRVRAVHGGSIECHLEAVAPYTPPPVVF